MSEAFRICTCTTAYDDRCPIHSWHPRHTPCPSCAEQRAENLRIARERNNWKQQAQDHEQELEQHSTDRVKQRAEIERLKALLETVKRDCSDCRNGVLLADSLLFDLDREDEDQP